MKTNVGIIKGHNPNMGSNQKEISMNGNHIKNPISGMCSLFPILEILNGNFLIPILITMYGIEIFFPVIYIMLYI